MLLLFGALRARRSPGLALLLLRPVHIALPQRAARQHVLIRLAPLHQSRVTVLQTESKNFEKQTFCARHFFNNMREKYLNNYQ